MYGKVWGHLIGVAALALLVCACGSSTDQLPTLPPQPVEAGTPATISTTGTLTLTVQVDPVQGNSASVEDAALLAKGEALYRTNCAPCHQANGEGNITIFPALNRNAFVTVRDPTGVINTVLFGREVMPAFAATLTNQEVAAVLSYIRNAWNNEAPLVQTQQVGERVNAREQ